MTASVELLSRVLALIEQPNWASVRGYVSENAELLYPATDAALDVVVTAARQGNAPRMCRLLDGLEGLRRSGEAGVDDAFAEEAQVAGYEVDGEELKPWFVHSGLPILMRSKDPWVVVTQTEVTSSFTACCTTCNPVHRAPAVSAITHSRRVGPQPSSDRRTVRPISAAGIPISSSVRDASGPSGGQRCFLIAPLMRQGGMFSRPGCSQARLGAQNEPAAPGRA
ncbi:MAG: hypothetical protein AB7V44_02365 [Pseudonocardia sp.]